MKHSALYNACPAGWRLERKAPLVSLWYCVDKPEWCVYSSNQWFRVGYSKVTECFTVFWGRWSLMKEMH